VRVPDQILKGVAFIGEVSHRDSDGRVFGDLHATGFFVSVRSEFFPERRFVYFVTAKHVADDMKDREPYILVNSKDGKGTTVLRNIEPYWFFHPTDKTADVAILRVAEQANAEHYAVIIDDFVTQQDIGEFQAVSIGDEVFIAGLFTPAPGYTRNLPILRIGNIAMLPKEQIQTELGFADVYLIEGRSIGGLSGSPIWVRRSETLKVRMEDGRWTSMTSSGPFKLLGVVQGHWDIKESEMNKALIQHDKKHGVNLGIAIITPAIKIADIINQPGMVKLRQEADEDLGRKRLL